ncbi:hypothetical protein SAMN05216223_112127 [Actinacidiphila yanglinensis]|uniref:Uncharacterized protein n=1 Tax=Actinacidiphila yanglinensis TaxID=310779 RepID=A0A1H6D7B7_9ACTN|nr:hypothetical protein [Actinacidiphila yanglinensis]SEG80928.1 hypothetical protein SAMN05216223_112127 [Actinacidiphila yanglinensis]
MSLAVVAPIRPRPLLQSPQDVTDFEQDLLSEFVLARAAAGLADETISGDVDALMEVRGWFGGPLWELVPTDLDRFVGEHQRRLATLTKVRKAQPPAADVDRLFADRRDDLHTARKYAPTVRNYTACRLAGLIGPRRQRWPHTRNPQVFIGSQTAHTRAPVTTGWMQPLLRGLPVTAQQLREDRILEEAAVTGGDPQHLCAVFNITPETGLHYTRFFHPDPTDSDEVSGCTMETS